MVPPDSHRVPRAPRYSGARLGFRRLRIRDCHPLRSDFPDCSPQRRAFLCRRSYNPRPAGTGLVWALPRSLATTGGITFCFLFLWVLRCFSSPGSPPPSRWMAVRQTAGLPHSGTPGSKTACVSPGLFAACRALHRLPEPQASAVRPFLLSPAPKPHAGERGAYLGIALVIE